MQKKGKKLAPLIVISYLVTVLLGVAPELPVLAGLAVHSVHDQEGEEASVDVLLE